MKKKKCSSMELVNAFDLDFDATDISRNYTRIHGGGDADISVLDLHFGVRVKTIQQYRQLREARAQFTPFVPGALSGDSTDADKQYVDEQDDEGEVVVVGKKKKKKKKSHHKFQMYDNFTNVYGGADIECVDEVDLYFVRLGDMIKFVHIGLSTVRYSGDLSDFDRAKAVLYMYFLFALECKGNRGRKAANGGFYNPIPLELMKRVKLPPIDGIATAARTNYRNIKGFFEQLRATEDTCTESGSVLRGWIDIMPSRYTRVSRRSPEVDPDLFEFENPGANSVTLKRSGKQSIKQRRRRKVANFRILVDTFFQKGSEALSDVTMETSAVFVLFMLMRQIGGRLWRECSGRVSHERMKRARVRGIGVLALTPTEFVYNSAISNIFDRSGSAASTSGGRVRNKKETRDGFSGRLPKEDGNRPGDGNPRKRQRV